MRRSPDPRTGLDRAARLLVGRERAEELAGDLEELRAFDTVHGRRRQWSRWLGLLIRWPYLHRRRRGVRSAIAVWVVAVSLALIGMATGSRLFVLALLVAAIAELHFWVFLALEFWNSSRGAPRD